MSRRAYVTLAAAAILVAALPIAAEGQSDRQAAGRVSGGMSTYTVLPGDSLTRVGSMFGVDASTIAAENHFDVEAPLAVGQVLRIDNRHITPDKMRAGGLVINIPQRLLMMAGDAGIDVLPVAVGRTDWPTPTGAFTIIETTRDPTWHVPASILAERARQGRPQPPVVPPGPDNPLGDVWMGLSLPGIGIHGTTAPASIYHAATHGCIRLRPEKARQLFGLVARGTPGRIIYEPILLAEADGEVYLEVHRDVYHRLADAPLQVVRNLAAEARLTARIDWAVAAAVVAAREGVARVVTVADR